jgi:hypothetical protein
MNLRRFLVVSGALLLVVVANIGGCGSGSTGSLTGGDDGGKSVCDGQFTDQGTPCTDCLTMHCDKEFTACCGAMYCENLANAARGKTCSGADCYGTQSMPGELRSLIQDPDFGGTFDVMGGAEGSPSPAWTTAQTLIACTVANCMDPSTMKPICIK